MISLNSKTTFVVENTDDRKLDKIFLVVKGDELLIDNVSQNLALIEQFNIAFRDKDAILRIIGSGPEEKNLRDKYSSSKVVFTGAKFNVIEFTSNYDFTIVALALAWGISIPTIYKINDILSDKN